MCLICGVDEAGRGPIAGPVTAAAVILTPNFPITILDDSKKILPARRQIVAEQIKKKAVAWAVGWAWPREIDELNIHHATLLAMKRAIDSLEVKPDLVQVDGLFTPVIDIECCAIKKGDTYVPSIQAASIIAKTQRDSWMREYSLVEPVYGFEKHKGYPTREHRERVKMYGVSPIHRRSFRII